jgi:hypothetical protein
VLLLSASILSFEERDFISILLKAEKMIVVLDECFVYLMS